MYYIARILFWNTGMHILGEILLGFILILDIYKLLKDLEKEKENKNE